MSNILVIEDDAALARGLVDNLEFEGYEVTHATSAETGLRLLDERRFDLLLLDLMLPGASGFEVLRAEQERSATLPIVVVSARDAEIDIVRALDLGARDYVRKPFGLAELLARVRRHLAGANATPEAEATVGEVACGDVQISLRHFRAGRGGANHLLSHTEVEILRLFLRHLDQPLRRGEIIDSVWRDDAYPTERTVDNFILKLRRKLERDPAQPQLIQTVHGVGYRFSWVSEQSS